MSETRPVISLLKWAVPSGLLLAALFSWLSGGDWLRGWLAFSALLVPGMAALAALWRWAGGGRRLGLIILVALLLRLVCGAALTLLLPPFGHDNPEQNAGYVFYDAFRRDTQAWELGASQKPLAQAFDTRKYVSDQYGGLLAASALIYRYLSADLHRQMLVIVLGALVAAMGIPLLWRSARSIQPLSSSSSRAEPEQQSGGEKNRALGLALAAAWIMAIYPESVLQASSQMREPFLITFTTFMVWGFLALRRLQVRSGWAWLGGGLLGLLLFSPGVALANLIILGGWMLLEGGHRRTSWLLGCALASVFLLAFVLLSASWSSAAAGSSPLGVMANWIQNTLKWNLHVLDRTSGMVQHLFRQMPAWLDLPFVAGYGMLQPVLPSALIEPTVMLWRVVGTLRALGWYALLPLLVYGVIAAFKSDDPMQRRLWLWLGAAVWTWIVISALRGGGDQWDDPRYRVILLPWQALLAGYALTSWLARRDRWLPRILVLEIVFLITFMLWYASRYYRFPLMSFWGYVIIVLVVGGALLVADLLREIKSRQPPP